MCNCHRFAWLICTIILVYVKVVRKRQILVACRFFVNLGLFTAARCHNNYKVHEQSRLHLNVSKYLSCHFFCLIKKSQLLLLVRSLYVMTSRYLMFYDISVKVDTNHITQRIVYELYYKEYIYCLWDDYTNNNCFHLFRFSQSK